MPDAIFIIEGTVCSGLGRGAGFLRIDWVERELLQKVNLNPFPGTLNLRIAEEIWGRIYAARDTYTKISDGSDQGCPGYVKAVVLRAHGRKYREAFALVPELTSYRDVLEIIAPVRLRGVLAINDGDVLSVEIL